MTAVQDGRSTKYDEARGASRRLSYMAEAKVEYECKECGHKVSLKEKPEKAPECCGKPMAQAAKRSGCGCHKK